VCVMLCVCVRSCVRTCVRACVCAFHLTRVHGAHSTGTDALWAGLPILAPTHMLPMAARVSASLLRAVRLDLLIARSLDEYEELGACLARNRRALLAVRRHLRQVRWTSPLFDTRRWMGDWERYNSCLLEFVRCEGFTCSFFFWHLLLRMSPVPLASASSSISLPPSPPHPYTHTHHTTPPHHCCSPSLRMLDHNCHRLRRWMSHGARDRAGEEEEELYLRAVLAPQISICVAGLRGLLACLLSLAGP
jgi:hypothetical protein